ncbi:type I restriction enzyme HsdR N-terminal domain-containing protein [Pseudoflavitalea sp. G-6-1-2]|uniref:type I restriction enzyme HsdR N-terminal domain-containing protein n=1 Tax=Pseudoflavitalea sp. G-6-1-2 TaxID=2728841 RepID=UPI00146EA177|nr:type I restriction enzyme HsdR N-terminal domain-containing protein [Pseudoflavitalea sp. G-6-1-2]NML22826.1 type I restriction enzyme HsdR N-terminal domain-containing protein [Pseudoflavitalea sp. G-6-1-2]
MLRIEFPEHPFRFKKVEEKEFIFDEFRKAWVRLTPEEWVRQNFLQYLLQRMQYPASMIAVERELKLGELKKRFDILVYDRQHKPWLMVECKAMGVPLEEAVLMQVLRYNIAIPVPYLVITNGEFSAGFVKNEQTLNPLVELPPFI